MKSNKEINELLIKFKEFKDGKELDYQINLLEKTLKKIDEHYYLKELESPEIILIEHQKPEKLKEQLEKTETKNILDLILPVETVQTNTNHITTKILSKIKHKTKILDTFDITCSIIGYSTYYTTNELETIISQRLKESLHIEKSIINPVWNIKIITIGPITAINIRHTRKKETEDYLLQPA
ncbi:MAG: hypothetical protein Q4Q23_08205 [Methanobacteriaceae archaeon]|nr:hypothetical protein [Methanobacteriaceae archaeon]